MQSIGPNPAFVGAMLRIDEVHEGGGDAEHRAMLCIDVNFVGVTSVARLLHSPGYLDWQIN